jgi:VanZ family protein
MPLRSLFRARQQRPHDGRKAYRFSDATRPAAAVHVPHVRLSDKICHFIAYCETAAAGWLAFRAAPAQKLVLPGVIALGGAIELAQHFVPGRSMDILDFTVNCLGVLAGYGLARLIETIWPAPAGSARA